MTRSRLFLLGMAAPVLLASAPAFAWHRHHRRIIVVPAEAPSEAPSGAQGALGAEPAGGWQAAAIARAAARMQAAPGVTNELAPDAKATATGGPVGGVPGFDGR